MGPARKRSGSAVLAMVCLGLVPPADGQPARLPMRIVTYDYAGVEPAVIERARTVVSQVFGELGVDPAWMDVESLASGMPKYSGEAQTFVGSVLQINVVSPAMHKRLGLKRSALGSATPGKRFAWISFDSARQLARQAGANLGDVVGYVIAHEIGHLLLPPSAHGVTGLMRENIDPLLIAHNRLSFSPEQAALIRAEVARRNDRYVRAR